ncbi:hypothetical protein IMZ48_26205 [Candidatus Bathyarchaeota archaeon]|nr:hypothetical protein [Candidatus Bathyarchaeota archaeon]
MTHEEKEELLIRVDERTARLEQWTTTHVDLHTRLSMAFAAAMISAILGLGTTITGLIVALCR